MNVTKNTYIFKKREQETNLIEISTTTYIMFEVCLAVIKK